MHIFLHLGIFQLFYYKHVQPISNSWRLHCICNHILPFAMRAGMLQLSYYTLLMAMT